VIFQDDELLVIDKPAGVAVHGGSGVAHGVVEQLRAAGPDARFLELVHRIDRDTSGVLVLARMRAALLALHRQLRERRADKRYLAIVRGRWPLRTKSFDQPLHRYLTAEGERRVRVQVRSSCLSSGRVGKLVHGVVLAACFQCGLTSEIFLMVVADV